MSMHYLPAKELHEEHSRPCPKCGAQVGQWCLSASGGRNTKSHSARVIIPERHTPLPDLSAWWKEQRELEKAAQHETMLRRRKYEARSSRHPAIAK